MVPAPLLPPSLAVRAGPPAGRVVSHYGGAWTALRAVTALRAGPSPVAQVQVSAAPFLAGQTLSPQRIETLCVRDPPRSYLPPREVLEGKGSERRPQQRLDRRLKEVAEAVGGGYCRLQIPLKLALGVRETVAGHRLGALERGGGATSPPSKASLPPRTTPCNPVGVCGWPCETKGSPYTFA